MKRKTAIATAGTIVTILLAGSVAVAANLGILSSTSRGEVGDLPSTTTSPMPTETLPPQLETVVVEEPVPLPPGSATPGGNEGRGDVEDNPERISSGEDFDEEDDDYEHDEHERNEHEDEHGYEDDD